ncbi:MAG: CPBP family glutamic-type intramembrane protease [Lachnospiraceae bacterium]|nr:CPBP family glutamic-type intramembrane protease [Lachnospiraceae bacterium]
MRLYGYYALHSFVNQIRKLFKTWVLIFIVACALMGGLIGFGAGMLSEVGEEQTEKTSELTEESDEYIVGAGVEGSDEYTVGAGAADSDTGDMPDTSVENGDVNEADSDDEVIFEVSDEDFAFEINGKDATSDLIELIVGGIILAVFLFELIGADKSGSSIFLPADVNLLFASPMKPQSVLLFRLMTQIGALVISSIYVMLQLPNLVLNLGLGIRGAVAIILVWIFTLVIGKLIQVLFYTMAATHTGMKPYLRKSVYALVLVVAAAYFLSSRSYGSDHFWAAAAFFNHKITRWIPFWGWLKGLCMFSIAGNTSLALLCLAALLAGCVVLILIIWSIKADFYEDAMAKSEETAELLEVRQAEKSTGFVKRKKDRSEKVRRDGMRYGSGANVFFFRSLYNRFRFAHLGIFTKTAEFYLVAAAGASALCRYLQDSAETDGLRFLPVVLTLSALAFWRTLGNPLEEDTSKDFFRMIPESTEKKLLWSVLGGTANCLLDMIPALILTEAVFRVQPLYILAWIPFILSIDFYGTTTGTFINLSVPVSAGKLVKQLVQIMFIYFGLLPDVAVIAVGVVFDQVVIAAVLAAVVNIGLGAAFLALTPLVVDPKDRPARRKSFQKETVCVTEKETITEAMILTGKAHQNQIEGERSSVAQEVLQNEKEAGLIRARKTFSTLGFGCFAILAIASVLQIATAMLFPEWLSTSWGLWVYTFAPLYVAAVPVGLLIFRRVPVCPEAEYMKQGCTDVYTMKSHSGSRMEESDENSSSGDNDISNEISSSGSNGIIDENNLAKKNAAADGCNNTENYKKSGRNRKEKHTMRPSQIVRTVFIAIFLMYAGNLLGTLVTTAISALTGTSAEAAITTYALADSLVLKILFMVILAPLIEEYVFRKQLIDRMSCYGERLAVVTSALMFGLFHGNFTQFFYAFALGLLFGYIYLKTGKLRYSAGLHMGINFLGSIVPSALLTMLDLSALENLENLETLSPEALGPLLPQLALYGGYVILLVASAIVGLVLFCRSWRRVSFAQAELELPKGVKIRTACGNAGMIVFVLGCAVLMIFSIFG